MADNVAVADRLEKNLDEHIAKIERSQKVTIAIGVILALVMVGYFSYMKSQVTKMTNPDDLSGILIDMVDKQIPVLTKSATDELSKSAEANINEGINAGLALIPELRKDANIYVNSKVGEILTHADKLHDEAMDEVLAAKRDEIRIIVDEIDKHDDQEALNKAMYEMLSEPFNKPELKMDVEAYGMALDMLAQKLERLRTAKDLTPDEVIERDLMIALKEISDRSK